MGKLRLFSIQLLLDLSFELNIIHVYSSVITAIEEMSFMSSCLREEFNKNS